MALAVRFLDDVIERNRYPIPQIDEMTKQTRKIGLGVMGWADLLFALRIPYDSEEALALAASVMAFVQERADRASEQLAVERGVFPAWHGSVYDPASGDARGGRRFRNSTRTTVAPTGTLSIIADCSGGIEPAFALAFMRQHYLDRADPTTPTMLPEVNSTFRRIAESEGFYSDDLVRYLAEGGSLSDRDDVPAWAQRVFVTSHDIAPEWHVKMQAAFQAHTDNAVSKTINFRSDATVDDVEAAYLLAYREGCKGITVYRDGAREHQVLSHATARGPEQAEAAAAEIALGFGDLLGAHPQPAASTAPRPAGTPYRRHLPDERQSLTHKFRVGEQEGYVTVGLYDEGQPGEIFVNISKEGSTIRGLMDSVAVLTSVALQYGVPLRQPRREVPRRTFRAERPDIQPGDPGGVVARRLHLPLARVALPQRRPGCATSPEGGRRRYAEDQRSPSRIKAADEHETGAIADRSCDRRRDEHGPRLSRLRRDPRVRRRLSHLPRLRLYALLT